MPKSLLGNVQNIDSHTISSSMQFFLVQTFQAFHINLEVVYHIHIAGLLISSQLGAFHTENA